MSWFPGSSLLKARVHMHKCKLLVRTPVSVLSISLQIIKSETTSQKLSCFPRISTGREIFPLRLRHTFMCVSLLPKGNLAVTEQYTIHLVMKLPFWTQLPEVFPWVLTGCFTETISAALPSTFTQYFCSQSCQYSPATSQIIKCLLRYCKNKLS